MLAAMPTRSRGSPPHAWGRLGGCLAAVARQRLTPTRVGTTVPVAGERNVAGAHPHTRGDDSLRPPRPIDSPGSPPHAWGRRMLIVFDEAVGGLTPTRVGTTRRIWRGRLRRRAHPHTRGDDEPALPARVCSAGSPPHAWGRRDQQRPGSGDPGLTPTRVGTTYLTASGRRSSGAHPHTRGDDRGVVRLGQFRRGSPPHAWGRHELIQVMHDARGLTPTRVGTTHADRVAPRYRQAHPHTRGDDHAIPARAPASRGSPPHAWGRPRHPGACSSVSGLTPTRVGTTR